MKCFCKSFRNIVLSAFLDSIGNLYGYFFLQIPCWRNLQNPFENSFFFGSLSIVLLKIYQENIIEKLYGNSFRDPLKIALEVPSPILLIIPLEIYSLIPLRSLRQIVWKLNYFPIPRAILDSQLHLKFLQQILGEVVWNFICEFLQNFL